MKGSLLCGEEGTYAGGNLCSNGVGIAEADPVDAAGEETAESIHELHRQLRLADAAHAGGYCGLGDNGRVFFLVIEKQVSKFEKFFLEKFEIKPKSS